MTKGRVKNEKYYILPTCSLHGFQLILNNTIQTLLGDGGLSTMNALQLLHSAANLQEGGGGAFEMSQFKKLWRELFTEDVKKITEPILSRWWTVGQGAIDIRIFLTSGR